MKFGGFAVTDVVIVSRRDDYQEELETQNADYDTV